MRAANDREVWKTVRDAFPHPYARGDAERWIAYNETLAPVINFAIECEGRAVGGAGLVIGSDVHRRTAEIGYWIGRAWWGRGLATAAVCALTEHAFVELGLVRVFAGVFAHNAASVRVLEKSGYEREGLMRAWAFKDGAHVDALLYARIALPRP